jgi:hypothetical protein
VSLLFHTWYTLYKTSSTAAQNSGRGYVRRGGPCGIGAERSDALDALGSAEWNRRDASSDDGLISTAPYVDEELDGGSSWLVISFVVMLAADKGIHLQEVILVVVQPARCQQG